jgi:hypothetical protein
MDKVLNEVLPLSLSPSMHGQEQGRSLVETMVAARWLEMMVSSDHPLADERVAEAIARVLSRHWVDATSGIEITMTHHGANITYRARAMRDDAAHTHRIHRQHVGDSAGQASLGGRRFM